MSDALRHALDAPRVHALTTPVRTDYARVAAELVEHLLGLHADPTQWRYDARSADGQPGIWLLSRSWHGLTTRTLWQPHGWALKGFPWAHVAQLVRTHLQAKHLLL